MIHLCLSINYIKLLFIFLRFRYRFQIQLYPIHQTFSTVKLFFLPIYKKIILNIIALLNSLMS